MELLDTNPAELNREEIINLLGRIEVYRFELNQLETDAMGELERS